jgi:hypothetical protein
MAQNLMSFLVELAVSPEKLAVYHANPDEAMKEAGLNAEECSALKSGDPAMVSASLWLKGKPPGPYPIFIVTLPPICVVVPPICVAMSLAEPICVAQPQGYPASSYSFAKVSLPAQSEPASEPAPETPPSESGPKKSSRGR